MNTATKAAIVAAVLATAGLAQAQNTTTNPSDPSQMTTPPQGATPGGSMSNPSDRSSRSPSTGTRPPRDPADPSQMTTQPEGARAEGMKDMGGSTSNRSTRSSASDTTGTTSSAATDTGSRSSRSSAASSTTGSSATTTDSDTVARAPRSDRN